MAEKKQPKLDDGFRGVFPEKNDGPKGGDPKTTDKASSAPKSRSLGGKLLRAGSRALGPLFLGMMINDIIKQAGNRTDEQSMARLSPFLLGQSQNMAMGSPEEMEMQRQLAMLLGQNADIQEALGSNLDQFVRG